MPNLTFCSRCVMDGTDPDLILDNKEVCNHCHSAQKSLKEIEAEKPNLPKIIERIKRDGKGKTYDCLIGMSGGVDSSMVLHHAVELGLRPLCFTIDNGFNNPKADENIMRLVETLKVPFYRYTIDLKKFSEAQSAFMRGGVMNLEVLTDHILFASTYEMANKYGIKWILSGGNSATESIMPKSFGPEDARDLRFIKSVYKENTGKELTGLPMISLWKEQYYRIIKQKKFLRLLDYTDYNRENSKNLLKELYNWTDYGEKHCESIFTQWYQSFYLFTKYGVDKRKAHFASLINSGQMTRSEAMFLLTASPVYPVLGIEERVLKYPKKSYNDYKNSAWIRKQVVKIYKFIPKSWKS